jgi:FKBP-type peptidyl-prolyl cis-trans isomerase
MEPVRLALALACAVALTPLAACQEKVPEPDPGPGSAVPPVKTAEPEPADLAKEDLTVGAGPEARDGDLVKVHYTGRLAKNNVEFDSSLGAGKTPFEFKIGAGDVIKGWDQGVPGMKVGGKRKLTIPSRLAYGDQGSPPKIPPRSTLVFEIELLGIGPFTSAKEAGAADKGEPKTDADKGAKK